MSTSTATITSTGERGRGWAAAAQIERARAEAAKDQSRLFFGDGRDRDASHHVLLASLRPSSNIVGEAAGASGSTQWDNHTVLVAGPRSPGQQIPHYFPVLSDLGDLG